MNTFALGFKFVNPLQFVLVSVSTCCRSRADPLLLSVGFKPSDHTEQLKSVSEKNLHQVGLSRSELNVKYPVKPCFKIIVSLADHRFKKLINKQGTSELCI